MRKHVKNPVQKYVKKPAQIEAVQFLGRNSVEIIEWAKTHGVTISEDPEAGVLNPRLARLLIHMLEGYMLEGGMQASCGNWVTYVTYGSWVIRGVDDDFYPCADNLFRATYDIVSE